MSDYIAPNPINTAKPYTCPNCQADIQLVTVYTGYDNENINPETGEWEEDSDTYTERGEIHGVDWQCSQCDWASTAEDIDQDEEEDSDETEADTE